MSDSENLASADRLGWFVELKWYEKSGRSFSMVAQGALCPRCYKRLKSGKEVSPEKIISTIRDCCSASENFITPRLPFLECAFRLILANGNQPLESGELLKRLSEQRGNLYCTAEVLARLLANDDYYGIDRAELKVQS